MIHRKQLPHYKIGRRVVFKEEDLLDYLERNKVLSASELRAEAENKIFKIKK